MSTLKTGTILDTIMETTRGRVAERVKARPLGELKAAVEATPPPRDALSALNRDTVALIAECKHASPSKGVLIEDYDPGALATDYAANGAAAISVLTDEDYFKGHLDHLRAVRAAVPVPILRKDFILTPYQLYEARAAGADLILLIAASLPDGLMASLYGLARDLGLTPLVEVHNEDEITRALTLDPVLLGINNRDLKTFTVSLETTERLAGMAPASALLVAESGIYTAEDVARMARAGAHAVLVGESIVRAGNVAEQVRALCSVKRGG